MTPIDSKFRFKSYEFKYNPKSFSITQERNLKKFVIPLQRNVIQDLGFTPCIIKGEGELIGDDVMLEYTKLYDIYNQNNSGLLYIPNLSPINCYFNKLSIVGKAGPMFLTYSFEFIEDYRTPLRFTGESSRYYIAKSGDSIYSISLALGIDVETLLQKNPHIINVLKIEEGVTLWL